LVFFDSDSDSASVILFTILLALFKRRMADNEGSADSVRDVPTTTPKRKRKPKLTEEEKAEKSKRLTEERVQRRNESKREIRRKPTSVSEARTYGSGISDGPRKPNTSKPVPDDVSALSSTLESQKEDGAVLSSSHPELPSEESEPFPTLAAPSEPTSVEPSTIDPELHRDSTPVDKAHCAGN